MSKIRFSSEQELAINASGSNYLISAGAGSGKTAVLTERIYRLAKKDHTLDHFLVLTFTNLAASEMKSRVRAKLVEDEETLPLASEVDNAHIETFDSFSLFLAKKYFYKLGISKDISITDNSILSIKRKKYLDEIFEELYEKEDSNFLSLIDNYASKNANVIKDYIISILEASDKKADNFEYLNYLKNNFFKEENVDSAISLYIEELKNDIEFIRKKAYELEDIEDADNIISFCDSLLIINDYDELREALKVGFVTKKKSAATDGKFRDKIKYYYDNSIKTTEKNDFGTAEEIKNKYFEIKPFIQTIINIAIEVENRLLSFKKEKNAFSFGDISRFVLHLLKDESIRKEISDSFDYIMVDEYQDTNDIQETVINAISKNNVYMVGDVKQSIYRFRGADCHIFQEKYEEYKLNRGGKEIDLNTSYRSRKEVVDFINDVFSQIMKKDINVIDYKNGHQFGFGRKEYEINKPSCSYKPEIYTFEYEKSDEVVDKECEIIIKDITNKINNKYQVFDNDLKGFRGCDYKDFAIIIDRGSSFDKYRQAFSKANIPLKVESKERLFKSDIISLTRSLIKLLYYSLNNDYENEYRHAYLSVARSFLFEYKDDVLYEIYKNKSFLLEPFAQKMELLKERLRFASLKEILLTLYQEYDIYASISKIGQLYANTHKLEQLLSISETMDKLNYTLSDLIEYFEDLSKLDVDIEYSDSDVQENSVTLINIHKSKGLEYGIIYYPGLNKDFNRQDILTSFLFSDHFGPVIPSKESNYSLFIHLIKKELLVSDFEEKIRLLYVALTRAKEKIILVSGQKIGRLPFNKPTSSRNMNDLLLLTDAFDKYIGRYSLDDVSINRNEDKIVTDKIILKEIKVPAKIVTRTRASKESDTEVDSSLLDFGNELHAYLEKMDLDNKSLDYIKNLRMKKYVYNVMNSSLFKGVSNKDVRHEFAFYDEESGIQGYIDALIIKENEIDIVDFKLKNIDDSEYDRQLRIYKSYIAKKTDKPVKMFLLAAITGEVREVLDE